jgi:hypothetical protein
MRSADSVTHISLGSTVVAAAGQASCDVGGEAVILNLTDGVYYGLDSVGGRVWRLVQEQRTAAEIRDQLLREYDVEPDRCEQDLLALLSEMAECRLIEVQPRA